jgi:hypothetical protein
MKFIYISLVIRLHVQLLFEILNTWVDSLGRVVYHMQLRGIIEGISTTRTNLKNHSITSLTNHGVLRVHTITYKIVKGYLFSPLTYHNKLKHITEKIQMFKDKDVSTILSAKINTKLPRNTRRKLVHYNRPLRLGHCDS